MTDSTPRRAVGKRNPRKPAKPSKDFPLYAHAVGRWAKKVRGKTHYFGKIVDDPKGVAALEKWLADKDELLAGRVPRANRDALTVVDLVNEFLTAKKHLLENGEITSRTFEEAHKTCGLLTTVFGRTRLVDDLAADDFDKLRRKMATDWGPVRLANKIQEVRSVFKYGFEAGLFDKPMRYGPTFKRPKKAVMRKARAEKGPRMFEPEQLRTLLDKASVPLKAMILLGINAGLGNSDVAKLPTTAVDLERGWLNFPRPKTGIERRCPLWPETVAALRAAQASRPNHASKDDAPLFFITKYGNPWSVQKSEELEGGEVKFLHDDAVGKEFAKLIRELKLYRPGLGFYTLRHCFETVGGGSRDQVAVNAIMGHVDETMAAAYREHIDDARLKGVADHVHAWLYPPAATPANPKRKPAAKPKAEAKPKSAPRSKRQRNVEDTSDGGPVLLRLFG